VSFFGTFFESIKEENNTHGYFMQASATASIAIPLMF
jgi:hypothetical protein